MRRIAIPTRPAVSISQLLDQQRSAVERSCGGPITKDLALGTLLVDALCIELLPEEACRLGKAAAVQLAGAKKADDSILGNARSKHAQARKRAMSSEKPAALEAQSKRNR